jgi:2-(1,2-epoxy-1,2-dihydrophenyl)acetyl-CoA isomerase
VSYEHLRVERDGNVATIILNRPQSANAIHLQLAHELHQAAASFDADPEVRAVVVTGAGRFFSGGGDLKDFASRVEELPHYLRRVTTYLHAAIACFHRMDAPVIMAVNGTAAGGGFSLAIAGDLVVARASAKFTMGYSSIGLSPDGTATYFLPRLVGMRRAQELALTDRLLSADEALQWGLVTTVFPDDVFDERVRELAIRIAQGPTRAYGKTKRLLASAFGHGLETQAELETRSIAALAGSADGPEGIRAFVEKRPPKFTGR